MNISTRLAGPNWPVRAQQVRLLDVFLIGPLMLWAGTATARKTPAAGAALWTFGIGTILYNGANYLATRRGNSQ